MIRPVFRGLAILAAILATSLVSPTPASADFPDVGQVYDTVDAVQSGPFDKSITITGVIVGQSTATTSTYQLRFSSTPSEDVAARCDRFALLAMAKPGKYQFATIAVSARPEFDCKLTTRTP
jgi:type IV secretory pathway VirB2 component (pilin)